MIRILLPLICLSLITACTVEDNTKIGPKGSWWLGGADGGVFIDINEDENLNDKLYVGTIYNDGDQSVWYRGRFKLVGDITFNVDNHDLYSFWDGELLHLQNSAYLEAIDPIPPL